MKKFWLYFLYAIIGLILVFIQLGFINALPYVFNKINLILITLILSLFFLDFKNSLVLMLILGFLLDVFSFNFFGVYMLALFLTVFAADFLLANYFTNRSFYSFLALTFLVTLIYNFGLYFLIYLTRFLEDRAFFLFTGNFWLGLVIELGWNLGAILLFFLIISLTSNRLRPVFLDKK